MESMQDKFMTTVRIGPKGQIVIPKEVRAMFGLEPGDSLILLADRERGIALQSSRYYDSFVRAVFDNGAKAAAPGVPEAETQVFASALERELKRGTASEHSGSGGPVQDLSGVPAARRVVCGGAGGHHGLHRP